MGNIEFAVKALILNGDKFLAFHKTGIQSPKYELPSGRMVFGETGCHFEIIEELGYIEESRAEHDFTQISNYFLTRVKGGKDEPQMTEAEIEEKTEVQWHTLEKALDIIINEKPNTYQQQYISLLFPFKSDIYI